MDRRMFSQDPPRILFLRNFEHRVHGDLVPGSTTTIQYDADRLPAERSTDNGAKAWTIKAYFKFIEQGAVYSIDMWTESGAIQTKMSNDTAEGSIMVCRIDIPQGVDHITLWFQNTGKSGAEYWDSNNGANYLFRFVAEDFHVDSVKVLSDPAKPLGWFNIDLTAVADVSAISVIYRVANDPAQSTGVTLALTAAPTPEPSGSRKWSGSAPVPPDAVVKFTFIYSAWGQEHTDTNNGNEYITWKGAKPERLAGVLA